MQYMINGHIVTMSEEDEKAHNESVADLQAQALVHLAFVNRNTRNELLAASDWTQFNDSPLTDEAKTSWATYRTALRDLPTNENWPSLGDDDWPTKPS